jgi:carbonic anhydrase/acetyltransferase-like protein (isoleucine patch superfamily)
VAGVGGKSPDIDPTAFTAPTSVVVGEVTLGAGASVWYSAVLRADCGPITLGADSNVQDNCTVHVDPGFPVSIGERVSIGHNAVVHGCTVEDDCLIGMSATILNGAVIGAGSLVAAGAVVLEGTVVPPRSLVAGVPAKVRRELSDEEFAGVQHYVVLQVAAGADADRGGVGPDGDAVKGAGVLGERCLADHRGAGRDEGGCVDGRGVPGESVNGSHAPSLGHTPGPLSYHLWSL